MSEWKCERCGEPEYPYVSHTCPPTREELSAESDRLRAELSARQMMAPTIEHAERIRDEALARAEKAEAELAAVRAESHRRGAMLDDLTRAYHGKTLLMPGQMLDEVDKWREQEDPMTHPLDEAIRRLLTDAGHAYDMRNKYHFNFHRDLRIAEHERIRSHIAAIRILRAHRDGDHALSAPIEEVDEMLRKAGADPVELGRRGARLVSALRRSASKPDTAFADSYRQASAQHGPEREACVVRIAPDNGRWAGHPAALARAAWESGFDSAVSAAAWAAVCAVVERKGG